MTAQEIRTYEAVETPRMSALQTALIQNRVTILDRHDVERYKKEVMDRSNQMRLICGLCSLAAGVALCVFAISVGVLHWNPAWPVGSMAAGIVTAIYGLNSVLSSQDRMHNWRWKTTTLPDFDIRMGAPAKVFDLGMKIAAETRSTPYVEYLGLDPFLYFEDNTGKYYVAVWDEKGFCIPQ